MNHSPNPHTKSPHARSTPHLASLILLAITIGLLGPVLGVLGAGFVRTILTGGLPVPVRGFAMTLAVAGGIGLLATTIAWIPARVMVRHRAFAGFILVPVLVPPYLIFAGYGMVRDPSWWVGSLLEQLAADGHAWVTISVGYTLAIGGLALWAFPIAAIVLAAGFRAQGQAIDDMLRLDARAVQRTVARVRMNMSGVLAAAGLVALVMIGSAVPLHLAQIPTMAIELWRQLGESPASDWDGVWTSAWPLVIVAVVGAVAVARWLEHSGSGGHDAHAGVSPVSRPSTVLAWTIWACATIVPLAIFAASLRSSSSLIEFWRLSGTGVSTAVGFGVVDAAVCLVLGMAGAWAASSPGRFARISSRVVLAAWVFAAVLPGVFIGSALAQLGTHLPRGFGDLLVVLSHINRFGVLGIIAGLVVGWSEPVARRELRAMDGATGFTGWLRACLPWQWATIAGAAAAVGVLGVHEIEATTLVLAPGRANLAGQILGYLHFSRTEELSAASVYLIGGGICIAGVASVLIFPRNRAS
jgi:ABC-type Fe3+ transport system permease subunit